MGRIGGRLITGVHPIVHDTSSRLAMAARLGAVLAFVLVLNVLLQSSAAAPAEEAAKALRVKRQDGGEILNGCDPNTAIGGFLLFPLFRAICAERGFEDVGAYGK